jgi:hypothetical protein
LKELPLQLPFLTINPEQEVRKPEKPSADDARTVKLSEIATGFNRLSCNLQILALMEHTGEADRLRRMARALDQIAATFWRKSQKRVRNV